MSKPPPTVAEYMTKSPYSIGLHETLASAYAKMRVHKVRHLPVLLGSKLVGLVTDPDLRTVELLRQADPTAISVEEAMIPVPYAVVVSDRLDTVAREMAREGYDAAVVMQDASVVGVFTATDALRALADLLGGGPRK